MAGKREKPEDIVTKLRQVEVLHGQGLSMADAAALCGGYTASGQLPSCMRGSFFGRRQRV